MRKTDSTFIIVGALIFGLLLLTLSCTTTKYTSENLPDVQIHFGEGGGFTGAVTTYCLLENGQILQKKNFVKDFEIFKKVRKGKAKKAFKYYQKKELHKIELDEPGDKYFFISYQANNQEQKATWGRNKAPIPEELKELYKTLKKLVEEKNSKIK